MGALAVVLLSSTRAIDVCDLAHFIHLSVGNMYPRPHPGQTYVYENGAFRLFNGVAPASLFQRCKAYADYVEGRICRIEKIPPRTDEGEISDAIDLLFQPITSRRVLAKRGAHREVDLFRTDFACERKGFAPGPLQKGRKSNQRLTD